MKKEIWAIGNRAGNNRWRVRGEENWVKKGMEAKGLLPALLRGGLSGDFISTLCHVVQLIADAPGKGATFVIGPWNNGKSERNLESSCVKMTPVFDVGAKWQLDQPVSKEILYQLAIQDGATIIATDDKRIYGRIQLSAIDDDGHPFDPTKWIPHAQQKKLIDLWDQDGDFRWEKWGKWFKWGTRHKTAAGLAYIGREKYQVLCISSDGDVHFFDGRRVELISRDSHL